jgi:hypothetical protein
VVVGDEGGGKRVGKVLSAQVKTNKAAQTEVGEKEDVPQNETLETAQTKPNCGKKRGAKTRRTRGGKRTTRRSEVGGGDAVMQVGGPVFFWTWD